MNYKMTMIGGGSTTPTDLWPWESMRITHPKEEFLFQPLTRTISLGWLFWEGRLPLVGCSTLLGRCQSACWKLDVPKIASQEYSTAMKIWMFQNHRHIWFLGPWKELSPPYLPSTGFASLGHRVAMPMCWCAPLLAHPNGRGISLAFFLFLFFLSGDVLHHFSAFSSVLQRSLSIF